jgi:tRNA(fMet)-specific endonuclease VapC
MFVLDTNICIYLIKARPPEVLEHLRATPVARMALSAVTVAELMYGVEKSMHPARNREALAALLAPLRVEPFDDRASEVYGRVRAELERQGNPIGALDTMIAAHALALNATLVTNDTREFERVNGLRLTNWTKPRGATSPP